MELFHSDVVQSFVNGHCKGFASRKAILRKVIFGKLRPILIRGGWQRFIAHVKTLIET